MLSLPLAAHCSVTITQQSKHSCFEVLHTHFASAAHFWLLDDFYPWSTIVLPTPGFAVFSEFFQASPVACGIVLLSTVTGQGTQREQTFLFSDLPFLQLLFLFGVFLFISLVD